MNDLIQYNKFLKRTGDRTYCMLSPAIKFLVIYKLGATRCGISCIANELQYMLWQSHCFVLIADT